MSIYADSHNFGRKVHKIGNKVLKPRPVGLEWLFLSKKSPLKQLLVSLDVFCVDDFVTLEFSDSDFSPSLAECAVDYVELSHSNLELNRSELLSIGSLIALSQWFGMGDLHSENIFIGYQGKNFVCSPIDIECIFEEYKLPSQSLIIPSYLIKEEESGLSEVFAQLNKADSEITSMLVFAYIDTYCKLADNSQKIFKAISDIIPLEQICSRVILRSTHKYYDHLEKKELLDVYEDESKQINNGDIPYFFRFLGKKEIFFWENEDSFVKSSILPNSFEKLEEQIPILSAEYIEEKSTTNYLKYGITQIARYFDMNKNNSYTSHYLDVKINYYDKDIEIVTPIGCFKCTR